MGKRNYSEEFRRDAVELYRVTPGATVEQIAEELGCSKTALCRWLATAGLATRGPRSLLREAAAKPGTDESPADELERLRREVKALQADKQRLMTEREILRKAAKYFAGEAGW